MTSFLSLTSASAQKREERKLSSQPQELKMAARKAFLKKFFKISREGGKVTQQATFLLARLELI